VGASGGRCLDGLGCKVDLDGWPRGGKRANGQSWGVGRRLMRLAARTHLHSEHATPGEAWVVFGGAGSIDMALLMELCQRRITGVDFGGVVS
jgi:hypothetical protein